MKSAAARAFARGRRSRLEAPNLTYDDDAFVRLGSPATIVYPVRDPRAVVASMERLSDIDFVGNQVRLMTERPRIAERYADDLCTMAEPPAAVGSAGGHVAREIGTRA